MEETADYSPDPALELEAETLFQQMMESLPSEFKYKLLLKALKLCGPDCLEGLEVARDAILYNASRQDPTLLRHVTAFLEGAMEGDMEDKGAYGDSDDDKGAWGGDGEEDEGAGDSADDGFEADLAYARGPTKHSTTSDYTEADLRMFGDAAFSKESRLPPPRVPPSAQPSTFSSTFVNAYSQHAETAAASAGRAPAQAAVDSSGDDRIRGFLDALLLPPQSNGAETLPSGDGTSIDVSQLDEATLQQISQVQSLYQDVLAGRGIAFEGGDESDGHDEEEV